MILFLGRANNYNYLNQTCLISSAEQLKAYYGESGPIVQAVSRAFEFDIDYCYVCNVHAVSDYFEIISQIEGLDIEYIVPIDLYYDKKIKLNDGRALPVYLALSDRLKNFHFILSDYHARTFVSFSHFLNHYNTIRFHLNQSNYKDKITLVANNLKESDYAGVDLACSLITSKIGHAPNLNHGESYYSLEVEDFLLPTPFFKNGLVINLFNCSSGIESNLIVQRTVYYLKRELDKDLEYLIGKRYNRNTLFTVYNRVKELLDSKNSIYYERYTIKDIAIKNNEIHIDTEILPFFSYDMIAVRNIVKGV